MADEPAYIRNLRTLSRADPKIENLEALEHEMYTSGSDRARAVLLGSLVEDHLERLIASKMRDDLNSPDRKRLFEYDGVVSSFSSKIIIAYAMKFIGPITKFDLDLIRTLRNAFAHSRISFDFEAPEVRAVCDQLKPPDLPESVSPFPLLETWARYGNMPSEDMRWAVDGTHPKTRFISTCHNAVVRMNIGRLGFRPGDFVYSNDDPLP
jgi:hypothetical protein